MRRSTGPNTPKRPIAFWTVLAAAVLVAAAAIFACLPAPPGGSSWVFAAQGAVGLILLFAVAAMFSRRVADREKAIAELEADLEAATHAAAAADRTKTAFLANMGHELRTPLNAIIGYSELLLEQGSATGQPMVEPDLRKILSSARHLLRLVEDILELSSINEDRMPVALEEVAIEQTVRDAAAAVEPLIAETGNNFELQCSPGIGSMRTDARRLRQTLLHLLGNAAKFTEKGRINLRVARRDDGMVSFTVADSGIGMDPRQLEGLFAPFAQGDPSPTRKHGGIGAGLAIARNFCRTLGGDITVESALGKGSTFTAFIPSEPKLSTQRSTLPSPCPKS